MSKDTNNYFITSIEEYHSNFTTIFGITIRFERSFKGIGGILLNYHLMCTMLVLASSINFLIDPKIVPGRAGVLVTLFLVMTSFFSDAQVLLKLHFLLTCFLINRPLFRNKKIVPNLML